MGRQRKSRNRGFFSHGRAGPDHESEGGQPAESGWRDSGRSDSAVSAHGRPEARTDLTKPITGAVAIKGGDHLPDKGLRSGAAKTSWDAASGAVAATLEGALCEATDGGPTRCSAASGDGATSEAARGDLSATSCKACTGPEGGATSDGPTGQVEAIAPAKHSAAAHASVAPFRHDQLGGATGRTVVAQVPPVSR